MKKVEWSIFKQVVDDSSLIIHESSDAENLSYRLECQDASLFWACSVFKTTPKSAAQIDYETNYQPAAVTG